MEMQQKDVDHQVEINQLNEQLQNQARNFQDEKAMLEREKHEALELAQKTIRDQGRVHLRSGQISLSERSVNP